MPASELRRPTGHARVFWIVFAVAAALLLVWSLFTSEWPLVVAFGLMGIAALLQLIVGQRRPVREQHG